MIVEAWQRWFAAGLRPAGTAPNEPIDDPIDYGRHLPLLRAAPPDDDIAPPLGG